MDYLNYNNSSALDIVFNSCIIHGDYDKLKKMYDDLQSVRCIMSKVQYIYWNNKISKALSEMENSGV